MFIRSILLTTCIIFSVLPTTAAASEKILNIEHWQTTSGARVYFVKTTVLPMIDVRVVFNAGSNRDEEKAGVAQLTTNMLNAGTKDLDVDQIAAGLDDVGAQYSASVSRDMAVVGLRSLVDPQYLKPALRIFTSVLSSPSFPENQFKRIKKQTLSQITQSEQSPGLVASKLFYKTLYDGQPYARPSIGTMKTVNDMTVQDLKHFYRRYYVSKNALIVIVGDLDIQHAQQMANQIVEKLPMGSSPKKLISSQPLAHEKIIHIDFPSQQTHVMLGQVGISRKNKNYFPLIVGNYILGGASMVSRLFNDVREQHGLAYSVYSYFLPLSYKGPFVIALQTRNEKSSEAIKMVHAVLNDFIKKGPTKKELTAAKNNIINGFPLRLASNTAITANLVVIGFYQLPLNYLDTFRDKIRTVTVKQIHQAFQQLIDTKKLVTITVGASSA